MTETLRGSFDRTTGLGRHVMLTDLSHGEYLTVSEGVRVGPDKDDPAYRVIWVGEDPVDCFNPERFRSARRLGDYLRSHVPRGEDMADLDDRGMYK